MCRDIIFLRHIWEVVADGLPGLRVVAEEAARGSFLFLENEKPRGEGLGLFRDGR